jgi:hypothetical protein
VVVVVSAELAHPEIKTAVSASAAKAISLFFIAVNSQAEGKLDASVSRRPKILLVLLLLIP